MSHPVNTPGECVPLDGTWKELVDTYWEVLGFGIGEGGTFALLRHIHTEALGFVNYVPGITGDFACITFLTGGWGI